MAELLFKKKKNFPLQDVDEPELFREQFPYSEVPRILFEEDAVELNPAEEIWITDTTFRDGQQARAPFTVKQIVDLYTFMHRLGGPNGVVRQSEFFLYSKRDREAVEKCLELGYDYPEITAWIRAKKEDLQLVKEIGLRETGILCSASDYHIFLKLKKTRRQAMEGYLSIVEEALFNGIRARIHLEDITRADIYGFCVPFAIELMKLYRKYGVPVRIRMCDTMGFGIEHPNAVLPRSIPKIVRALNADAGVYSRLLEWHGHNDFYRVHTNGVTAWLYGCSALNASLLGIGERTGNPPLEAAIIDYMGLKGQRDEIDPAVITEIADYFRNEIKHEIPQDQPFVGAEFNTTRAGIHVDGLQKNEEIYNIFDTGALLNRPLAITITDKSGAAGIAHWVNTYLKLEPRSRVDKRHPGIIEILTWVNDQYLDGRVTAISNDEILEQAIRYLPEYFDTDIYYVKEAARNLMADSINKLTSLPEIISMNPERQEPILEKVFKQHPFVQLALIADKDGQKNTSIFTRDGRIADLDEEKLDKDYIKRAWFLVPMENEHIHVTGMFKSKITNMLGITISAPIKQGDNVVGVLRLDCKFEELMQVARSEMSDKMELI
jgi:isopropylmalate/homocitrate/citramalate synthase